MKCKKNVLKNLFSDILKQCIMQAGFEGYHSIQSLRSLTFVRLYVNIPLKECNKILIIFKNMYVSRK